MENNCVLLEIIGDVAWVRINRPDNLNVLNSEVIGALKKQLKTLDADPMIKVVVITGTGEKAFVAGGDIKEMVGMDPLAARSFSRKGHKLIETIANLHKPVIAAVNGYALGGGLELALACDFIYASENARLGLPEVTLGVIPGFGGTQNLPRLVGPNRARELIFSGRALTAQQAKEWGIVNEVFPLEVLKEKVMEVAQAIARNGALAVASARDAVANGASMSKEGSLRYESSLFGTLFSTEDQKEGMEAFIAKRKAEFKGK